MRYETPIFLGVVTVAAAFLDMLLFVPPAHCQQQVPIQSPAAHTQPVALATQSQTGVPARQSVASLSPPQATVAIQTKPGESRPALKNSDPLTAAMAAFPASLTTLARHEFETAFRKLPSFCHDWQTKLHEREINNLAKHGRRKAATKPQSTLAMAKSMAACARSQPRACLSGR